MNKIHERLRINQADYQTFQVTKELYKWQNDDQYILSLYKRFKDDKIIEWKDSIKEVLEKE